MSLNIKNRHTHDLVRELADVLEVSQTEAVTLAVSERLERERHTSTGRLQALRMTAEAVRGHVIRDGQDHLYDRDGLFA